MENRYIKASQTVISRKNQLDMRLKLLIAILVSILAIHNADTQETGLQIRQLDSGVADKTKCDTNLFFDCVNCTTRAICDSVQNILSTIKCGGDTPYCSAGSCTSVKPDTNCKNPVSPLCPGEGTFPSTSGCTKYVKCDAEKRAIEYQCPVNLVYDPDKGVCKRRALITDCPVINCAFNRNKFIVYPGDKRIYFYCGASNSDIIVLQCPKNTEFNPTTVMCETSCSETGFIAAPDPSKFYMCVQNGNGYDKYLQECPLGTTFNSTAQGCGF